MKKNTKSLASSSIVFFRKISLDNPKFYLPLLFLILFLAFFLRSNLYLHGDFLFLLDQARDLMLVKQIVIGHTLPLIGARSGLGGVFHGPLWLFMITPFFIIFDGNPFWTLVPLFLLVNVGIILLAFFVINKLYDTTTALIVSFLLAVNPSLIGANSITTNAQVFPLVFLLYFWGIIEYLRGRDGYIALALLATGLGFQFESAFAVFLIPLTSIALLFSRRLPKLKPVVIGVLLFFLAVSNFILFELRHKFLMTHSVINLFSNKIQPIKGYEQFANIGFRVGDRLQHLAGYYTISLFKPSIISIILVLAVQILAIYFAVKKSNKQKVTGFEKEYLFLFIIPFLYFALYIFYPMPLWGQYVLTIYFIAAIFLGLSIKIILPFSYGKVMSGLLFLAILIPVFVSLWQTYSSKYNPTADGSYVNQLKVANAVFKDASGKKFGYFEYNPGILTYQMDFLMWYLGNKYNNTPINRKQPVTYLIMYNYPQGDPGAYSFWKKNIVRTNGKVIMHKIFPGHIVLEKLKISPNEQPPDPNYYQNLLFR